MQRKFKYYPDDFPELKVEVEHMDLIFDVYDDYTKVSSDLSFRAKEKLEKVELNAKKLEIHKVECEKEISYEYDKGASKLIIEFGKPVEEGERVVIHTETTCRPTHHDLEGLYYDSTPEGAPPQQITQCQQWGFEKLVPCFDRMKAKCTYRTKIIADSRYSHLISNGDVAEERKELGNGRSEIVYENMKTPMAPYLFFLGVGTWEEFNREFEYPDGKKFMLELLAFPGADKEAAEKSLEILAYGVRWIYAFTGPETFRDRDKKEKLFGLMEKLDKIKAGKEEGSREKTRNEISETVKGLSLGYEYTGSVYREIAMQNSNFGGMENVGNTTITANRIMPYKEMSDGVFAYLMEVKTHEFYHNLNGSEVTSKSPFELWLNEALTQVVGEQQFLEYAAGKEYSRLGNVLTIISTHGTFNEDTGAMGLPIIPEGFNNPDELITSVTYSKSPEFVNMVKLLMGEEEFFRRLDAYHKKHSHSNAGTEDWLREMEKGCGHSLKKMADSWLKQTGYPVVNVKPEYDDVKGTCILDCRQESLGDAGAWEFPLKYALFNSKGEKLSEGMKHFKNVKEKINAECSERPAFYSLNRDFSFYGKISMDRSEEELYLQAEKDDDIIGRYLAFYEIADREKTRLIERPEEEASEKFSELIFSLLSDRELSDRIGTSLIAITNSVEDEFKRHYYEELYQARKKIRKKILEKHENDLKKFYEERKSRTVEAPYVEQKFFEIKNREVKNACLGILSERDDKDTWKIIKKQWREANNQADRLRAFSLYIGSSAPDKMEILKEFEEEAKGNPVEWEQYLALIASNDSEDTLEMVKRAKSLKEFDITQSNDQRALMMVFAMNRRLSLAREDGRKFLKECILELSKTNEYNTNNILGVFGDLNYMPEKYLAELVEILVKVFDSLNPDESPSVYNNIRRILSSAPRAVKKYEEEKGKLPEKYF